ncbi:phage terminase large subunit family protein [Shewanella submarina]|uniref:Phage terminase large subunit family protein n=1 Tax=Shewanella submarina TaxID=2016376 RepID=A0ABV7G588_9GAMM|nr:phage terminase large subunit family protein [Shewanella submarina]MCL1038344.1 phage terminase large subunit family protein [Shewanella submarina]
MSQIQSLADCRRNFFAALAPPPVLKVSDWADEYRILSSEASAEPGRWNTDRAPYQREMLDSVCDPEVERVTCMTSAQVGKTELLLNVSGFFMHHDPSPIMTVQPTVDMAKAYSTDRLSPMIRDCPHLASLVDGGQKDKVLHKTFTGGHITLVGSNSPSSLASRPIRIVLADEVDRYPFSAGAEGDPFNLAVKRTTTFWNRKIFAVSTPTIRGSSRIEQMYELSDKRRWHLPCPECGHLQPLTWGQITFEPVGHSCIECGTVSTEFAWKSQKGIWIPERPEVKNHRGYHLNELVSPWRMWQQVIDDFKAAKGSPETLKTWVNTSLGESFQSEGDSLTTSEIANRRETYSADVPAEVVTLSAGVDVQADRLEILVIGSGQKGELWNIDFQIIRGDPSQPLVWKALDQYLLEPMKSEKGHLMRVRTCFIDTGYLGDHVRMFTKPRESRGVFGCRGSSARDKVFFTNRPSTSNEQKAAVYQLGVSDGKDKLFQQLKINMPGAGYIHYPRKLCFDDEFFEQLTSERAEIRYKDGRPQRVYVAQRKRNEALDITLYAIAANQHFISNYVAGGGCG